MSLIASACTSWPPDEAHTLPQFGLRRIDAIVRRAPLSEALEGVPCCSLGRGPAADARKGHAALGCERDTSVQWDDLRRWRRRTRHHLQVRRWPLHRKI